MYTILYLNTYLVMSRNGEKAWKFNGHNVLGILTISSITCCCILFL